jgi:hypothetical protein
MKMDLLQTLYGKANTNLKLSDNGKFNIWTDQLQNIIIQTKDINMMYH